MTPAELQAQLDAVNDQFATGELSLYEWKKQSQKLQKQLREQQEETPVEYVLPEDPRVLGVVPLGESPMVYPDIREANVEKARIQYIKSQEDYYIIQRKKSPEEARRLADRDANKLFVPPTTEYQEQPSWGVSRIRDVEKNLVRDSKTGELREAGFGEMAVEALGRQVIATAPEFERAQEIRKEELRRASFERQKRQEIARKEREEMKGPQALGYEILDIAETLGTTGAAAGEEVAIDVLTEPAPETGMVVESYLGAGLRDLVSVPPAVVAAGLEIVMPGTVESDTYRKADSNDFSDQIIVNLAKGQGLPQLFESNVHLVETLGEDAAWWLGFWSEVPLPITGIPTTLRAISGAGRVTGRGLGKAGLTKTGGVIEGIANPREAARYNATKVMVDDMLVQHGAGKKADDIIDDWYAGTFTWDDWLDASAKRNTLSAQTGNLIGERVSSLYMLKAAASQGDITIAGIGDLSNTPTTAAILTEMKVADDLDAVIDAKQLNRIVDTEIAKLQKAATVNEDFARIVNTAEAEAKKVSEGMSKTIEFEDVPRLNTTRLNQEIQNEIMRVQFAKNVSSNDNFMKALKDGLASGKTVLKQELNKAVSNAYEFSDLGVVTQALRNNLARKYTDNIRDLMPEDLYLLGGDVVVSTRSWNKKGERKKYFDARAKEEARIEYDADANIYKVVGDTPAAKQKNALAMLEDLVDYIGVDTLRKSDLYKQVLEQLGKGELDPVARAILEKAWINKAAKEIGGFRISSGGEQFQRASIPLEARGDILATSEAFSFGEQVAKGGIGKFLKDMRVAKQIIKAKRAGNPTMTPIAGASLAPEFHTLNQRVSMKIDRVVDNFNEELERRSKETGDPVGVLDEMMEDAFKMSLADRLFRTEQTVQDGFEGDWSAYARTFLKERFSSKVWNRVIRDFGEDATQETWKEVVLDYDTYLFKWDTWRELLSTFYGPSYVEIATENLKIHPELIRNKGLYGLSDPGRRAEAFDPRASNVLDLNLSNLQLIVKRIKDEVEAGTRGWQDKAKTLADKSLKVVWGKKEAVTLPAQEYILGIRRGKVVNDEIKIFVETHPEYRKEMIPDYTNLEMELDLKPLEGDYNTILNRTFAGAAEQLLGVSRESERALGVMEIANFGNDLAKVHWETMSKISPGNRAKLIAWVSSLWGGKNLGQGTLQPDLTSARRQLQDLLKAPKIIIDKEIDRIVGAFQRVAGETGAKQKFFDDLANDIKEQTWDLYFGGRQVDGIYYANPSMGVLQDVLQVTKDFYRAHGLAVGDDIFTSLSANAPMFKSVSGTNYQLVYGQAAMDIVNNLSDMAKATKLRTMMDRMRKADEGGWAYLRANIGTAAEFVRRTMTQGMLGGLPLPNIRYLGMNILTAPLIMMGTVGVNRTGASMRYMKDAISVLKAPPNKVMFQSRGGRKWTAGELRGLESDFNLGLTRQKVELYEGTATESMRKAGLDISGQPLSKVDDLKNFINISQRNLYSHAADASDLTFRRATFYSALADDVPVEQAIKLSKKSLLDYGAMSQKERSWAQKYVTFWSFTRQIFSELLNTTAKATKSGNHNAIFRAQRAAMRQQQEAGSWLYANDRAKARLYSMWSGMMDGLPAYTYGFANPYVESFETLLNLSVLVVSPVVGNEGDTARAWSNFIADQNVLPHIDLTIDLMLGRVRESVPPEDVLWLKASGMWDVFQDTFGIQIYAVPVEERRQQDPTFTEYDVQYRMDKAGAKRYAVIMSLLLHMGLQRNIRDYSKLAATMGSTFGTDPDANLKRYDLPNPALFMIGAETSLRSKEQLETIRASERRLTQELKSLKREKE